MRVGILGLGLIGGSFGLALRKNNLAEKIYGFDNNLEHLTQAKDLKLVDITCNSLDELLENSDLIVLAVNVKSIINLTSNILDKIKKDQILIDLGSTKKMVCDLVKNHKNRKNFIAAHPMAGTEFSGPNAAIDNLFEKKQIIICDKELSNNDFINKIINIFEKMGMNIKYMPSQDHDVSAAYVSHISHLTSFALALTVLEKEKNKENIFTLSAGGFESTVRLAKSSHTTWSPIFEQNSENVLEVLDTFIDKIKLLKECIKKNDYETLNVLILEANKIKKIINKNN